MSWTDILKNVKRKCRKCGKTFMAKKIGGSEYRYERCMECIREQDSVDVGGGDETDDV